MKKLIGLIAICLIGLATFAQERTISKEIPTDGTYLNVSSFSSTLDIVKATTNDTLDVKIKNTNHNYVSKVALHLQLDTIDGTDTVSVQLLGYDFLDDASANVIIAADTTRVTSSSEIILFDDYQAGADELSFRYYVIRIRHLGTGLGCRLKEVEFKLYVQ